ncbi:hypothetical protein RHMOL_Rhmol09G0132700 [Rhododendron molle]|uniref:Uncharacterized protein n=1 Tax=Rhododendron molle TaxID=49168 RepID=A0ACC0MD37_RHOML|nr:hypothetical protein RHMOL_Rhmol09G0132700 [Rhododendron molle]
MPTTAVLFLLCTTKEIGSSAMIFRLVVSRLVSISAVHTMLSVTFPDLYSAFLLLFRTVLFCTVTFMPNQQGMSLGSPFAEGDVLCMMMYSCWNSV